MLKELHLQHVGPASHFDVEFAERLNIFTGDNGLGKSFLLDVAWWVLTENWVDQPAYPQRHIEELPKINSKIDIKNREIALNEIDTQSYFDFSEQKWQGNWHKDNLSKSLIIFVRVDGSFAIFDPARKRDNVYNFNPDMLWNGLILKGKVVCNGLIHDWVTWQNQPNKYPFQLFFNFIKKLAPHPDEWIEIGEPTRVSVEDVRDIPTINLPYGNVPNRNGSLMHNFRKKGTRLGSLGTYSWRQMRVSSRPNEIRITIIVTF